MFEDITIPLDVQQQTLLSNWAVKTAMVLDSVKNSESHARYYLKAECETFRTKHLIPDRTRIWIGRYSKSALGANGTDLRIFAPSDSSEIGLGSATTVMALLRRRCQLL
jgi:hypothetical protein